MDLSKIDWAHVAVSAAVGAVALPVLAPVLGITAVGAALGIVATPALGAVVGGAASALGHMATGTPKS